MKLLKVTCQFFGEYTHIEEYRLLPASLMEIESFDFKMGLNEDVIGLGEIEGKHSDCYGDLLLEEIESDNFNLVELKELVDNSSADYLDYYLENIEEYPLVDINSRDFLNLDEEEQQKEIETEKERQQKITEIAKEFGVQADKDFLLPYRELSDAVDRKLKEKLENLVILNVTKEDAELIRKFMAQNNMKEL